MQRQLNPVSNRAQWQVLPVELNELPIIQPEPNPPAPQLPAPKPQPPTPQPPPKPAVKPGSELPDAFSYCPYQYYGKITTLQRTLCQGSWKQWYRKQVESGKVAENMLKAYNVAGAARVGNGTYGVIGAWDKNRDYDLLLGGLSEVDENTLQEMWSVASKALNAPHEEPDPALAQFLQTLGDGSAKLDRWMLTLQEAISQGPRSRKTVGVLALGGRYDFVENLIEGHIVRVSLGVVRLWRTSREIAL